MADSLTSAPNSTPAPSRLQIMRTVAAGAMLGAMAGAGLAYVAARRNPRALRLSTPQALKMGMLLLGTFRQIAAMLEEIETA